MKSLRVQILLDDSGRRHASTVEAELDGLSCHVLGQVYAQAVMMAANAAAGLESALRSAGEFEQAEEFHRAYATRLADPKLGQTVQERIEFRNAPPPEETG